MLSFCKNILGWVFLFLKTIAKLLIVAIAVGRWLELDVFIALEF